MALICSRPESGLADIAIDVWSWIFSYILEQAIVCWTTRIELSAKCGCHGFINDMAHSRHAGIVALSVPQAAGNGMV